MCILSFIPGNVELDQYAVDSLWNGGINNPDGHGWAIASPTGMLVGKSLRLDSALSDYLDARELHPASPSLFHSRWATHGSIKTANCHPFYVGNSDKTVLAHNGVLPKAAHPAIGDDRSDTAIMAGELLPKQWRRLDRPTVFNSLSQFCGRGNKLVILTVDPKYRKNAYIVNESAGNWDKASGIWHSNYDYLYVVGSYKSLDEPSYTLEELELVDPTACHFCNQRVNDYGICTTCGTCQDCSEYEADCLCLIPESLKRM
jgi:glutamine amidotransferase